MKEYKRNCCAKRSILEKILIVVIVLLLCLLITLFVIFVLHLQNGKDKITTVPERLSVSPSAIQNKKIPICLSQSCIQAASQIIEFIDPTVDPCDNFYNFVCGKFLNRSLTTNEITPLNKFEATTSNQIDSLITDPVDEPIPKSWALQRQYYKMCMNTEAIETDNTKTFSHLIQKIGDWPVLFGRFWNERKFNWLSATIQCRQIGFGYEHFLRITAHSGNTTGPILLSISPPSPINLPYQIRELYIDMMANISIELGAASYLAKNEFIRVFKFEEELRSYAQDEMENGDEVIISVSKLQEDFPSINWISFLNKITATSAPFNEHSLIRFHANRYLTNFLMLLERTPKATQANYVIWKIIENFRSYLKESIRSRYEEFLRVLNPNLAFLNNRHVYCLDKAKFYFPSVAELAYVRKYLKSAVRNDIKNIAQQINLEFIEKIKITDWIDRKSKNITINTLSEVRKHIGASDYAFTEDFDKIVEMDGFTLNTTNIMDMATKLYVKKADNYFKIVNQDPKNIIQKALERNPILSANVFYNKEFATLVIPAPLLQGVIYDLHRPQYINFGALGSMIGHELTRGFVNNEGRVEKNRQWSPETVHLYKEKIQCLLDNYNNYSSQLQDFTNDAKLVLEEHLADLIGPQISYSAYQKKIQLSKEPTLPSLPYSQNQLFWISSVIYRCYQPKIPFNFNFGQNHVMASLAATLSVKNSDDFARDFKCPSGSKMNPEKKCKIM